MVIFEEVNGKLVPRGSEEDIKAYLDYKKGLKKKTYKLKVKVTAAGNKSYKKLTKKVTVKIKVK